MKPLKEYTMVELVGGAVLTTFGVIVAIHLSPIVFALILIGLIRLISL